MHVEAKIILFLFIAAVMIVIAITSGLHNQKVERAFESLAEHYGGTLHKGGWFGQASTHFEHNGLQVLVDIHSTGGKHPTYYTQVQYRWPDSSLRCELTPEGFFNRIGKMLGMEDIEIGDSDFDERFIITGSHPAALKSFLSPEVRRTITQLQRLTGNNHVYVRIAGGRLLVKKLGKLSHEKPLKELVALALSIFDAAHEQAANLEAAQGIEFLERGQTADTVDAICQICGDQLNAVSEIVYCRRCKTPHHQDCWNYYGACSTYGCGGTNFSKQAK